MGTPRCTNPCVYSCQMHCLSGSLTDAGLPVRGPQLLPLPCVGAAPASSPSFAKGEATIRTATLAPLPGTGQCTWVQMSPQTQGPPFFGIVLTWSCPALQDRPCTGWFLFFSPLSKNTSQVHFYLVLLFQAWRTQRGPNLSRPSLYREGWWIASQETS